MYQKHHQKVAVVGMGSVGSAVAFGLINQGLCDEVLLINRNHDKALGEAMDLRQSIEYMGRNTKVWAGDLSDCADAQIVIFCLGTTSNVDRNGALKDSCTFMRPIVEKIMASGFEGFFINVTNPVDTISHFIWKVSGLPHSHVIGTGTANDTARLKCFLGKIVNVDPHCISAYTMGEHGESQFIPWSTVNLGGKPMDVIIKENPDMFKVREKHHTEDFKDYMLEKVKRAGWRIKDLKGCTSYGIASAALAIARAILLDENRIIPCSTYLNGQYGMRDVFISVPSIICGDGVRDVVELHLSQEEMAYFMKSVETVKSYIKLSEQY